MSETTTETPTGIEPKEFINRALSTAYNLDEQGVASLYNEEGNLIPEAFDKFNELDRQRVAKLKGDVERIKSDRYSMGKKEALSALENELRERFGVKSDLQGLELIDHVIQTKAPQAEGITDEGVKKHPLYRGLETKAAELEKTWEEKLQKAIDAKDAEFQRKQSEALFVEEASAYLDTLRPKLPADPVKAKNQRRFFEESVRILPHQVDDNGGNRSFLLLDNEGKRLEDGHGHPVKVQEKWKEIAAAFFDFEEGEVRSSAGSPSKGTKGDGVLALKKPANQEEYNAAILKINEMSDAKEKAAAFKQLQELWKS